MGLPWLGQFKVSRTKTLYLAREDSALRIQQRVLQINTSYSYPPLPNNRVKFTDRPHFYLNDDEDVCWLVDTVVQHGIKFVGSSGKWGGGWFACDSGPVCFCSGILLKDIYQ